MSLCICKLFSGIFNLHFDTYGFTAVLMHIFKDECGHLVSKACSCILFSVCLFVLFTHNSCSLQISYMITVSHTLFQKSE